MSRNPMGAPGCGRLQHSRTGFEGCYPAVSPRSGVYRVLDGSEGFVAWTISKRGMSWGNVLMTVSLGRLIVNTVKKHGHIHSFMKGIEHLRDGPS